MAARRNLSSFRSIAFFIILAGAGASLDFVLHTGAKNHSIFLVLLFVVWVLSPFVGLLAANAMSIRWPSRNRVLFYVLVLLISVGSVACYSGALKFPGARPAFVFLAIPLISWLLIGVMVQASRMSTLKQVNQGGTT